ncbi:FkbM family methyltransferase [Polynucleobacter paneuropaeus]|nr:FkbM family methyltransferase [Polynucleobacter paneuropaeus]
MSWRTSTIGIYLRNISRAIGITHLIQTYLLSKDYEKEYDSKFSALIKSGDCIWDIGANVGYYTAHFAKIVGPAGQVFAFEPSPINFAILQKNCHSLTNVKVLDFALGQKEESVVLMQGEDEIGATSRITASETTSNAALTHTIRVLPGNLIIAQGLAQTPNALKIDTEGFELDVLLGLTELIQNPQLRLIGVEVHFKLLRDRGLPNAPQAIEKMLQKAGFQVRWTDTSHIIAVR